MRLILLIIALMAIALTFARSQVNRLEQVNRDVETLEKMGFVVDLETKEEPFFARFTTRFDGFPTYIRLYQGPLDSQEVNELLEICHRQHRLQKLIVSVPISDSDAARLLHLPIDTLGISENSVGDSLTTTASPTFEWLSFHRTRMNDIGLRALGSMPHLKYLDLTRTRVSDQSIEYLSQLPSLETVILRRCKVTAEGAERLRKLRPDIKVSWQQLLHP